MTTLNTPVRKAVIPAAGLGTRFLPATKAMPKEMLPVVDKPAIQYVVEEAVNVGLNDILMITGRNKRALEDHFDRVPALEATLEAKGDTAKLESIQAASNLGDIHYVRQGDPMGLGHAVLRAKQHVGYEPFAVLLGDDLIDARDELLSTMIDVQAKTGGSVVALIEVDPSQISAYGCADIQAVNGEDVRPHQPASLRSPTSTMPRPTSPSSAATSSTRRSSRSWSTPHPAAAAKSS